MVFSASVSRSSSEDMESVSGVDVSHATFCAIADARLHERLVYGIDACANTLNTEADDILACVLPLDGYEDATTRIYYKLLEAVCYDSDVPLLQVDSSAKLREVVNCVMSAGRDPKREKLAADCSVMLIMKPSPTETVSDNHRKLVSYMDIYQKYGLAMPPVVLPPR